MEQLQADMIVDCLEDGLKPFITLFGEKDEARKVMALLLHQDFYQLLATSLLCIGIHRSSLAYVRGLSSVLHCRSGQDSY